MVSLAIRLPRDICALLANLQITAVDKITDDVNAVLILELNQVGLAILHLIEAGYFVRIDGNVGELVIAKDGMNVEGRFIAFEAVVERKLLRVHGPVLVFVGAHLLLRVFSHACQFGLSPLKLRFCARSLRGRYECRRLFE